MKEYADLVAEVLSNGTLKENRTGVDTRSTFAYSYKIDLQDGFPLLTQKKVNFNAVLREFLWYLSGEEHIRNLQKHTKIWNAWADNEGRLQTAYGRYWRRYPVPEGSSMLDGEVFVDYDNPFVIEEEDGSLSFDQISWAINELKKNPNSRRIIINAWHPANATVSKLPPCHAFWVLNVQGNKLNCHLTQRSADIAIGVPFNIACYALLTEVIANEVGLEAGEFSHTLVDAHIYVNHIKGLVAQICRDFRELPELIVPHRKPVLELEFEDFELIDYNPHDAIKFEVVV